MRIRSVLLLLSVLVTGCATPVGQFTEHDFDWIEVRADVGYQALYRRMLDNFRRCGNAVPEGNMYTDTRVAHIDVYLPGAYGGRSDWVIGVIDIRATGDNASMIRAGVNKSHPESRREGYGAQWRDWANQQPNQYTCRTVGR